jgi:hypothetical protein
MREKLLEEGAIRSGALQRTDLRAGEERATIGCELNATRQATTPSRGFGENLDYKVLLETTRPAFGRSGRCPLAPIPGRGRIPYCRKRRFIRLLLVWELW